MNAAFATTDIVYCLEKGSIHRYRGLPMIVMSSHPCHAAASIASAANEPDPTMTTFLPARSDVPMTESIPFFLPAYVMTPLKASTPLMPLSSRDHCSCANIPHVTQRYSHLSETFSPDFSFTAETAYEPSLRDLTSYTRVPNKA